MLWRKNQLASAALREVEAVGVLVGVDAARLVAHVVDAGPFLQRQRPVFEQLPGHGMDAVGGNLVAGERRRRLEHVAGGIEDARRRIVDGNQVAAGIAQAREVAGPPGGERHRRRRRQRLGLAQPFPVEQEEQPVAAVQQLGNDDGAADRRAVLVALERRDRPIVAIEVVLRVERRMARELEDRAVQLVGARLRRGVDLRDRPAVLRVEQAGEDVELLQRVHRRQQHVGVEVQVGVLDPVQRVVVVVDALAGDVQREAVALPAHALLALGSTRDRWSWHRG